MSVAAVLGVLAHSKKLKFCIDVNFLSITFPPQPGDTRWGSWQDASDWFVSMWKPWCSFVHAEAQCATRGRGKLMYGQFCI